MAGKLRADGRNETGFTPVDFSGKNVYVTISRHSNGKWEMDSLSSDADLVPESLEAKMGGTGKRAKNIMLVSSTYRGYCRYVLLENAEGEIQVVFLPTDTADLGGKEICTEDVKTININESDEKITSLEQIIVPDVLYDFSEVSQLVSNFQIDENNLELSSGAESAVTKRNSSYLYAIVVLFTAILGAIVYKCIS